MILLVAGGTHTGKTLAAQKLLEAFHVPYLSIDHLKMGLIRSGMCPLSPESSDEELTAYLWPVVREMVRTAVENGQHLIVEGCYIPFGWEDGFCAEQRAHIACVRLILSEGYLRAHYDDIVAYENAIEQRQGSFCPMNELLQENRENLERCREHGCDYILVEERYDIDDALMRRGAACFANSGGCAR